MLLKVKVHMKIRAATEETWFYITHIKIVFLYVYIFSS